MVPRLSNCILYAVGRWWRRGGYVVIRKSNYGPFPHFMWSADLLTFESFIPMRPAHERWFPPPLFRGRVVVVRVPEPGPGQGQGPGPGPGPRS